MKITAAFWWYAWQPLSILAVGDDLYKIRPSNLYHPAGFRPSGSDDPCWSSIEDIFFPSISVSGWNIFIESSEQWNFQGKISSAAMLAIWRNTRFGLTYASSRFFGDCHVHTDFGIWLRLSEFHLTSSVKFFTQLSRLMIRESLWGENLRLISDFWC